MGKIDVFVISLTGEKKVFYPGEVLNGVVILKLNKELKMRGIRLEFHGEANVRWSESTGSGENRRTRTYHNNETYINTLATLYGKDPGQSGDNPVLPPGDYSYPFSFIIPSQNLPTSFEGRYGHIRYWLKAIIDRPWRFDVTTKAAFSMIEFVDINNPQTVNPLQTEENRNVGCLCCVSGPLTTVVQTDRGGYCPGESISVSVFVNNKTKRELPGIEVRLVQHVVFIASSGKQKHFSNDLVSTAQPGLHPGDDRHYPGIQVPIPPLPPTMSSCSCIRVWYEVQVVVQVSGCSSNSKLRIPVVLGSVPFRPPFPPAQPYWQPSAEASAPPMYPGQAPPYTEQQYPGPPPPSYAECVYGSTAIRDDGDGQGAMGDMNFTPCYPFVNNYQPPPPSNQPPALRK